MTSFREKLWPAPWLYVASALVIPASLLALAPISIEAGIVTAIVLYAACIVALLLAAPVIEVTGDRVQAGKATISRSFVGEATAYTGPDAVAARGPELDARAWLLLRGWVQPVVKVQITDPADPAPYWLLSSRQPHKLVAALQGARRPDGEETESSSGNG